MGKCTEHSSAYVDYCIEGNQVCATRNDFKDLQASNAGYGDSLRESFIDLFNNLKEKPNLNNLREWELKWVKEITF